MGAHANTDEQSATSRIAFAQLIPSDSGPSHIIYCHTDGTMVRSDWESAGAAREEWERLGIALCDTHVAVATTFIRPDLVCYCAPVIMPEGHLALVLEFAVGNSPSDRRSLQYGPLETPEMAALASALAQGLAKLMDARATVPLPSKIQ